MRVIGGEYRSRPLKTLCGAALRPTPDRLREALFNVLSAAVPGCSFLDAYAGCGAVGIEALSRGASRATFIEKHRAAVRVLEENLNALAAQPRARVIHGRVLAHLERVEADIVFLDPPYELTREYAGALEMLGRKPPPLVIAQHSVRLILAESYGALQQTRILRQGDNVLTFFGPASEVSTGEIALDGQLRSTSVKPGFPIGRSLAPLYQPPIGGGPASPSPHRLVALH